MKLLKITVLLALLIGAVACIDETIQLNNFSDDIVLQRKLAIPLLKASFTFEEIAGRDYDSLAFLGNGDTIWIYLPFDLELEDTFQVSMEQQDIEVEYLSLYYKITNMFPVGLDIRFYLYDSILGHNIDTILFGENPEDVFIQPASHNEDGITIEEEIATDSGFVALDEQLMDRLFNETSHLIIKAQVPATGGIVKVLENYRLDLQFGVDTKVRYRPGNDSLQNSGI